VTLATTFATGAVYHVGQERPLREAEAFIAASESRFVEAAQAAIEALAAGLRGGGLEPVAAAVLARASRPLPALDAILRSHPLVHAAEAELYRRVIVRGCQACRLPVALVTPLGLAGQVALATRLAERQVLALLEGAGKASGRPWTKDQKEASLAAWHTLATGPRAGATAPSPRPPP
jgi:hypothetical protein